jgi:hypothetical protein
MVELTRINAFQNYALTLALHFDVLFCTAVLCAASGVIIIIAELGWLHALTTTLHYITEERTGMRSPRRWLASAVHSTIQQGENIVFLSSIENNCLPCCATAYRS